MKRTPSSRKEGAIAPSFLLLGTCLLLTLVPSPASAQLSYLETADLRLVYFDPTLTYLAPHAARCFENSMRFQSEIFGLEPSDKVTVLLSDFSDRGNAAASAVPRNMLQFQVAPMDFTFESFVAPERMYMLMNHELVHVTTTDMAAGSDRVFRRLFAGKVRPIPEHPETILYHYLTSPRTAAPRWFKEGTAVFHETWMAGGIGRAQGSYDEMVFRSMVRDGSRFYDPLGLVSEGVKSDFQLEANSYLYGTRFLTYLAYRYSPEHLLDWVRRGDNSKRYYVSQFRQVFGVPLTEAWQEWIDWEHAFQEANLERIREYAVTPYADLSSRALGSVSRPYLDADTNTLYAAFNYPGVVGHVGAISLADGSIERIIEVKRPAGYSVTSLAFDPREKLLYYTTDNRDLRDLRAVDPATGKSRTLIKDGRIGDLVFDAADGSLWGLRHFNGIVSLVRVPPPHEEWQTVRSWPYGEVLYDLDVSPDGSLVSAAVAELSGRHVLRVWRVEDLAGEEIEPVAEVDFGTTIPMNFVFSPDGDSLYGSTYYTGVANVFRYELASGKLEALTNTETGFFRPIPLADGGLLVFRYSGEGFVPARIDAVEPLEDVNAILFLGQRTIDMHPELRNWRVGSPAEIPLDSMVQAQGKYESRRNVGLESLYPVVEGYKDSAAAGLRFNLSDYFNLIEASATASYTPDHAIPSDERLHLDLQFRRRNLRARARLNNADFYDLFGPTKQSLKGYSFGLGYEKLLVWDEPREMTFEVASTFYGDLERLPDYQNVSAPFDRLWTTAVGLRYENLRGSLGHVDEEKGWQWEVVGVGDYVNDDTIPSLRTRLDLGLPLPLRHSSVWFRTYAGAASGERDDPFANAFFGGFGNNYVDHEEIRRYREWYAFPGLELNEVGGKTYVRGLLEWNLPPARFRRVGWPSFYATWASTSLFVGGLVTNPDDEPTRRTLRNVGAQMDFRLTLMSNIDLTVSLGYAVAFESGLPSRDEVMASLTILR